MPGWDAQVASVPAEPSAPSFGRLSIVIANHNYASFVGQAISSALAIDYPDLEVVVVDDGSSDGSVQVIASFADQVTFIATGNQGQREAANTGFAASSGDVVVFLDSDDLLPPDLAQHLARRWTSRTSKAQFRMQRIDALGATLGGVFPHVPAGTSPADLRDWFLRTSAYPTPPGSANAYARWFLDAVMPVGPDLGDAADSALLAAAPVLGDVVDVPDVVVGYRRHGGNLSNLTLSADRYVLEVERALVRWRFACELAQAAPMASPRPLTDRVLRRSRELVQLRCAALRVGGKVVLEGDGRRQLLVDTLTSPFAPGPEPVPVRMLIVGYCLAVLLLPGRLARLLVQRRFGRWD